jgi:hypothetical protein
MNNVLRRRVSLLGTLNIVDSSLSNDGVIVTGGGNFLAQALQRLTKFVPDFGAVRTGFGPIGDIGRAILL